MARHKPNTAQLSIDFDAPTPKTVTRQPQTDKVRARVAQFHPDSSQIEASRYALKFSISGRSYEVRGVYHLAEFSASMDDSLARVVDFVHVDKVLTYRSGAYLHLAVQKTDELYLIHATRETLADAYLNPFLTSQSTRETRV
jgi:hypothetical protein